MLRGLIFILLSFSVKADEEVNRFFAQYVEMERKYDTAVADFYLDDAVLLISHDVKGSSPIKIKGSKLKKEIRRLADKVRSNKDFNIYSNIQITNNNDGTYLITAHRTSNMRCYTDTSYQMTVTKVPDGSIKIVKESGVVSRINKCSK